METSTNIKEHHLPIVKPYDERQMEILARLGDHYSGGKEMTTTNIPRSIWLTNSILKAYDYREAKLSLSEDEDFLYLMRDNKVIARFNHTVDTRDIWAVADQAVQWAKSGIEFIRTSSWHGEEGWNH